MSARQLQPTDSTTKRPWQNFSCRSATACYIKSSSCKFSTKPVHLENTCEMMRAAVLVAITDRYIDVALVARAKSAKMKHIDRKSDLITA